MNLSQIPAKSYWTLKGWARGVAAHVYDWEMERHLSRLRASNAARRRALERGRNVAAPGTVFVIVNVDAEGPCSAHERTTWDAVERETSAALSLDFRREFPDTTGNLPVLNWFIVDWVGATASARGRDLGFHRILDHYREPLDQARRNGLRDETYWHYHHTQPGDVESSNRRWSQHPQYEEVLCRWVLDRGQFPTCYRAGSTWEDDEASAWLERWIPFDFSSRSPQRGPHFDWSRAPTSWTVYRPSPADYQQPGDGRRAMGRSLSLEKGWFRAEEVEAAFLNAAEGRDSYVSFFTHDYRPLCDLIRSGWRTIGDVARRHPDIRFVHTDAVDAMRRLTGRPRGETLTLTVAAGEEIVIEANRSLFGRQPWIAARDEAGAYFRLDAIAQDAERRRWTIARRDLTSRNVATAAAAACDDAGNSAVTPLPLETRW